MSDTTEIARFEPPAPTRLVSLDAYRGFVMLAMASGGLAMGKVAQSFPGNRFWEALAYQCDHVAWAGCSFWDLIQPSFMFIVGVAMPFSYARRRAEGDSTGKMLFHVAYRSAILVLLGIFLSSNWGDRTDFTFVNVLTQIGLGYTFVFLLLGKRPGVQLATALLILAGTWLAFALWPVGPQLDYAGASSGPYGGFFAHWNKHVNIAGDFDLWFLNLFPRKEAFRFNGGGYQTLNFVPSMATMLFGVLTGEYLRGPGELGGKVKRLALAGLLCLCLGWGLGAMVCPSVKRIWTPSWTIFSTGWTLVLLAGFLWAIDLRGWRRPAFPLVVVGMNSIAMYCMAQLLKPWFARTLKTHLGAKLFEGFDRFAPMAESAAVLLCMWLCCYWMFRRKIFLRI